jgi:uncharacterized membrane protein
VGGGTFLGLPGPAWHAALNDVPVVLLVVSAVFDLLATGPRREVLRPVAYWTLVAGAGGAIAAVVSGVLVKDGFEHTAAVRRMIDTHLWLGIALAAVFTALAGWRTWRRNNLSAVEQQSYTTAALISVLALLWTAHLGGNMVYRHAAGIPSSVLQAELDARAEGR